MNEFALDILTPAARVFQGRATMLVAPGRDGYFGVLRGHLSMVAALKAGRIRIQGAEGGREWLCGAGVASVEPERVTLLVESLKEDAVQSPVSVK